MDDLAAGAVTAADAARIVLLLRDLAARARDHGQQSFHFVFATTADSLADNVETVIEWQEESDG